MKYFLFLIIFLIFGTSVHSQKSVNDYKYVIVPMSYSFLNENDAYQLNSLTKFLFNKYGFITYMRGDSFPEDLKNNGCKALSADVKKSKGLFITKLKIHLTDCSGNIVYISSEGTSREKEYRKAYQEALRVAFEDVERLNYKYNEAKEEGNTEKSAVAPIPQKETSASNSDVDTNEVEKATVSTPSEDSTSYTFNDKKFVLKKKPYGYAFFQQQKGKLISLGKVYKMTSDNSYLVSAKDLSGGGYFDGYGNFILERINPATDKLIIDTLARQ